MRWVGVVVGLGGFGGGAESSGEEVVGVVVVGVSSLLLLLPCLTVSKPSSPSSAGTRIKESPMLRKEEEGAVVAGAITKRVGGTAAGSFHSKEAEKVFLVHARFF